MIRAHPIDDIIGAYQKAYPIKQVIYYEGGPNSRTAYTQSLANSKKTFRKTTVSIMKAYLDGDHEQLVKYGCLPTVYYHGDGNGGPDRNLTYFARYYFVSDDEDVYIRLFVVSPGSDLLIFESHDALHFWVKHDSPNKPSGQFKGSSSFNRLLSSPEMMDIQKIQQEEPKTLLFSTFPDLSAESQASLDKTVEDFRASIFSQVGRVLVSD